MRWVLWNLKLPEFCFEKKNWKCLILCKSNSNYYRTGISSQTLPLSLMWEISQMDTTVLSVKTTPFAICPHPPSPSFLNLLNIQYWISEFNENTVHKKKMRRNTSINAYRSEENTEISNQYWGFGHWDFSEDWNHDLPQTIPAVPICASWRASKTSG